MVEGHGDDRHKYSKKVLHNFSSNVYHKGCHNSLINHIQNNISVVENYPSPMASELNTVAAHYFNLSTNQFLFGNGATELFYLIAQCFSGKTATIVAPTFSEYQDACEMYGLAVHLISWENLEIHQYKTDLVFICNPNNPTGQIITVNQIENLLKRFPKTVFVIDEAYVDFCKETTSCLSLLSSYQNLIIVKSLTKTFAVPGIRLGYMVSNATIINNLIKFKQPWTVNALAITAGVYIFNHYQDLLFSREKLIKKTAAFRHQVNQIPYLETLESHTNYFLVKVLKHTASLLKNDLMEQHQILVRDATNFKLIEGEYIRLSLQKEASNKALLKALKQWS